MSFAIFERKPREAGPVCSQLGESLGERGPAHARPGSEVGRIETVLLMALLIKQSTIELFHTVGCDQFYPSEFIIRGFVTSERTCV